MTDTFNLGRFIDAQAGGVYERALREIQSGRKTTHWMWFIFPQHEALGVSSTSRLYGLKSLAEATAYLDHAVLGPRLLTCAEAALNAPGDSAEAIFGYPDDLKLRSSATLFAQVSGSDSVFQKVLDRFFEGEPDPQTIQLVN